MREILFRGKRRDNGEWVEGSLLCFKGFSIFEEHVWKNYFTVDSATVGQYTGLNDRNGKRIFEGDIVRHYNRHDDPDAYDRGLVFWNKKSCRFVRTSEEDTVWLGDHCEYEVIGNIYDTPELLGVSV